MSRPHDERTGEQTGDGLGDAAVALTTELIAIDTVNPSLVPGAPGESGAVAALSRRLAANGFEIEIVTPDDAPDRPSLLATARRGDGPRLVLEGHLDTVGVGAMGAPHTPHVIGDRVTGRLHGRGACDMKGGIAAMVVAAEDAVARASFSGEIVLALVADEEHASIGVEVVRDRLLAAGRRPDWCLITEPTWCDLVVAHRGFEVLEVSFRGRAAHSSQPERAVDTVRQLGRFLAAVETHDRELQARAPHPFARHGSLLTTVVRAGSAPFTIADRTTAVVERRTRPDEPDGIGGTEVLTLVERLRAEDPTLEVTVTPLLAQPAWSADDGDRTAQLLAALQRGLTGAGRAAPARRGAPYWMESAVWAAAGVATVVCGPAGGGMHADDEWLDLGQLRAVTAAVRSVIDELLPMTP